MRDIGGHDERMISAEHLDTSLRLLANGHKILYAPRSHVTYRAFDLFTDDDWPYFFYRWALHRKIESDRVFAENWGLYYDQRDLYSNFVIRHQNRAIANSWFKLPKWLKPPAKVNKKIYSAKRRRALKFDAKLPDAVNPRILPKPPENGLDLAGIAWTDKAEKH